MLRKTFLKFSYTKKKPKNQLNNKNSFVYL